MLPRESANEDEVLVEQLDYLLQHRDTCLDGHCRECGRLAAIRAILTAMFSQWT